MSERRKHPRAPIQLEVEYKRLNSFFSDYTHNIGRGGTFIQTQKPLPIGTKFVFRLTVPQLDDPLVLNGKVRWRETDESAGAGMGIEFEFATDDEKDALASTVEHLMESSLGPVLVEKLKKFSSEQEGHPAMPNGPSTDAAAGSVEVDGPDSTPPD